MGEARDKIRRVPAAIAERITYKPWKGTYFQVAVCNCDDWESQPGDIHTPNDRDDMTRQIWRHIEAKHLGCRHGCTESPRRCRCGNYEACCVADMDEHVAALTADSADHG